MRPGEVLAVFGEPRVYEDWMGGNLNDSLFFHGLVFFFSDCDAYAPLPDSTLYEVWVRQREDAFLFDRPMCEWTKEALFGELQSQGYVVVTHAKGAIFVQNKDTGQVVLDISFDDEGHLTSASI